MATYTTNLHLKKPADSDSYNINDANGNMEAIDTAWGAKVPSKVYAVEGSGFTINFANNARHFIFMTGSSANQRSAAFFVTAGGAGAINVLLLNKGTGLTYTTSDNKVVITLNASTRTFIGDVNFSGDDITISDIVTPTT